EGNNPPNGWQQRYAPVPSDKTNDQTYPAFQYCTGDNLFTSPGPATTYTVLKATVPGQPSAAQPVAGCPPITFPSFTGDIAAALSGGVTPDGAPAPFVKYFRQ